MVLGLAGVILFIYYPELIKNEPFRGMNGQTNPFNLAV